MKYFQIFLNILKNFQIFLEYFKIIQKNWRRIKELFRANSIRWWQLCNNSIRSVKQHGLYFASLYFARFSKKKKKKKKNQIRTCEIFRLSKNRRLKMCKLSLEWKSQIQQIQTCEIVCLTETCGIWLEN